MASLDTVMMKWEWVVGGEGRTASMASEVYMDKGMCKSRKTGSHRSTKMLANKKNGQLW